MVFKQFVETKIEVVDPRSKSWCCSMHGWNVSSMVVDGWKVRSGLAISSAFWSQTFPTIEFWRGMKPMV